MNATEQTKSSVARYLANFQRYYPGILEWYSGLQNEFVTGRRGMFVSWNGMEVQGLAITKNGRSAKLCHISVCPGVRNHGIGQTLIQLALGDMVRHGAREIRVTTSEEVFRDHASFFRTAGFKMIDWQVHRYRHNVSELFWKMEVDSALYRLTSTPRTGQEWIDRGTATSHSAHPNKLISRHRIASMMTLFSAQKDSTNATERTIPEIIACIGEPSMPRMLSLMDAQLDRTCERLCPFENSEALIPLLLHPDHHEEDCYQGRRNEVHLFPNGGNVWNSDGKTLLQPASHVFSAQLNPRSSTPHGPDNELDSDSKRIFRRRQLMTMPRIRAGYHGRPF